MNDGGGGGDDGEFLVGADARDSGAAGLDADGVAEPAPWGASSAGDMGNPPKSKGISEPSLIWPALVPAPGAGAGAGTVALAPLGFKLPADPLAAGVGLLVMPLAFGFGWP